MNERVFRFYSCFDQIFFFFGMVHSGHLMNGRQATTPRSLSRNRLIFSFHMFFSLHFEVELKCLYKYVNGAMLSLSTAISFGWLEESSRKECSLALKSRDTLSA